MVGQVRSLEGGTSEAREVYSTLLPRPADEVESHALARRIRREMTGRLTLSDGTTMKAERRRIGRREFLSLAGRGIAAGVAAGAVPRGVLGAGDVTTDIQREFPLAV